MHVSQTLHPRDFSLTVDGRPARLEDVLPGFDVDARVAIVSRTPGAPFGAATMLLALVTAWYDERTRRAAGGSFYEYPDYFLLQIGAEQADLGMLEIWPPRKRVTVEPDAEQILGALSDRAIDYVLVEDGRPRAGRVLRETLHALTRHLRAALAYAPDGNAIGADVVVSGPPAADALVAQAIADSTNVPAAVRHGAAAVRRGSSAERLRRVDLPTALGLLCPPAGAAVERPLGLTARDRTVARLAEGVPDSMLAPIGSQGPDR